MFCALLALTASISSVSVALCASVEWFQTCESTEDRLSAQTPLSFSTDDGSTTTFSVTIDPSTTYQKIFGFGGALTQSSATVYKKLPKHLRHKVIEAYYGSTGIGYTTGRLPIHSCDFSVDTYTFDDVAGDESLQYFDTEVKYDQNLSLPLIHDALDANPELLLYGSPWSPPAWMKDSNEMCCGGSLLDDYKATWAKYFSKWITAYEKQGVSIWGVTVQNEPEAAQTWESCIYTPESTRDFVAEHLGPVLESDHPDVKILGFDHNKDHLEQWADTLLSNDSSSQKYIDGIAFHWYSGSCFANVQTVTERYPAALFLPSEACYELTVLEDDASEDSWLVNGTWSKGEGYGYDIWGDLESGSAGWTDWNILLDQDGGPNHVDNFCDAAIIAHVPDDEDSSSNNKKNKKNNKNSKNSNPNHTHTEDLDIAIYFHPQYYYLGHFSKFLRPGAQRVHTEVTGGGGDDSTCVWPYGGCNGDNLHVTSWQLPTSTPIDTVSSTVSDGSRSGLGKAAENNAGRKVLAVVVMNCGDTDKDMKLTLTGTDQMLLNNVPAHSIQTYLIPMD